jgi:hypothetical protein
MFPSLKQKLLLTSGPTSSQSHTAVIDTLGYDRLSLGIGFSTVAETTPEITLKLGEGDTTSAFTDIPAFTGGTATSTSVGFVIPAPPTNTSVADTLQMDVDLRHRKRYLLLTSTPFTTKTITSFATFGTPEQGPPAATSDNLMARVSG